MLDVKWNPSRRELRQFAAIGLPIFAAVFGSVLLYRSGSLETAIVIWSGALAVAAIGVVMPAAVKPLYVGWMALAYPIGWTVSHVLLAVLYYLLFTPIGWTLRLLGRDPLERTFDRSAGTYWVNHDPGGDPPSYFRQS